ncbi:hypothetical protein CB0940_01578 [Cercospora beticola]|uniref:Uncharacterized protein n=1 Tax=Cercospora beticola TaxID=122368 RepID=A0A2G5I862_CERBT|nr:hypothetical protein CB0940_01578 [Cercospora beticola]PIB00998.1 hypothetical protein CB0940_01578 [Cercospora beticola]WPA97019.1 hypothetical protein RHO25_001627 [Cercospora beticola]CAK1354584.1 unnamed protein product [Cercospora beticola]
MAQSESTINVLLATFAGLGLPRTLSLPTKASTPISDIYSTIQSRLPPSAGEDLLITTVSNKQLLPHNDSPITTLLSSPDDTLLSLRLSRRLCGGKGGFGSQLRAAGGRMSSRKNRNSNVNPNASNRNLDGRRLRTVDEAKRLAEYLAIKPEMEKKEKEERKKRWQEVVDAAERREEEIKSGKGGAARGRLDAEWVEGKEDAENKTREAVIRAMKEGLLEERTGSESSAKADESEDEDVEESSDSSEGVKAEASNGGGGRSFYGWDEDEDESSEDDEEPAPAYEVKGKGKATA